MLRKYFLLVQEVDLEIFKRCGIDTLFLLILLCIARFFKILGIKQKIFWDNIDMRKKPKIFVTY